VFTRTSALRRCRELRTRYRISNVRKTPSHVKRPETKGAPARTKHRLATKREKQKKPIASAPEGSQQTSIALEDQGEALLKACHGRDARNPILWLLIVGRYHLETCRVLDPDKPLASALFERSARRDGLHTRGAIQLGFFEAAANAILKRDSSFFREVARLLEQRIGRGPERRIDDAAITCVTILEARTGSLPTKRDVRECVRELIATDRVMGRTKWRTIGDIYEFPTGGGKARLKPALSNEIEKELAGSFPKQDWTKIWKRCGLSHLPADKGGQPTHKKQRYSL
jgi:hypothetical protein